MFDTLSDRLDKVFTSLRGKGKLSESDIDATARTASEVLAASCASWLRFSAS